MTAEDLKKPGWEVLLPLLPFTRDGKRREVLVDMITSLKAAGLHSLLPIGKLCAGKVFTKPKEQQMIQEVFAMVQEFLEDSWVYQEIKEQGKQEGKQEGEIIGIGETLKDCVEFHFPELLSLAAQQIQQARTPEILHQAVRTILRAQTTEEARQALLRITASPDTN
jgi:hypothetical protein